MNNLEREVSCIFIIKLVGQIESGKKNVPDYFTFSHVLNNCFNEIKNQKNSHKLVVLLIYILFICIHSAQKEKKTASEGNLNLFRNIPCAEISWKLIRPNFFHLKKISMCSFLKKLYLDKHLYYFQEMSSLFTSSTHQLLISRLSTQNSSAVKLTRKIQQAQVISHKKLSTTKKTPHSYPKNQIVRNNTCFHKSN